MSLTEKQLKNLRRRIEEFLRHTSPEYLIRIAVFLNTFMKAQIKIPKSLLDKFLTNGD